jgi:iron complex transport system substrate-binding protein
VPAAPVYPLTISDGLQRTLTFDAPAQRIISLAPSNTEILFAIGADSQLVGRDVLSDFPPEAANITDIGDTFIGLNTELIISLEPDLVLAAEITPVEQVAQLEQLGVPIFWLANPADFDGLYANLAIVGQLTGRQEEAAALAAVLQERVAAVDAAIAEKTNTPTVFYELDASDPAAPWTSGAGTFIDLLIARAGGHNAAANVDGAFAQLSIEELLVQNPDVILLGDAAYGITVESVGQRVGWADLAAVRSGSVYPFDDNLISRPGPRLVDALEELARLLHPDLVD